MKKLIRSEKLRPVIVIVALALVIALNAAASGLSHIDLSANRAATLSGQAQDAVRALNEPEIREEAVSRNLLSSAENVLYQLWKYNEKVIRKLSLPEV